MPLSINAQNASLDNDYGATRGSNAPDSLEVLLYAGDPALDGVEIADTTEDDDNPGVFVDNGYAPAVIANDGTIWAAAADGLKATVAPVQFADALASWETVTHFVLRDEATGDLWDAAPLLEPLDVTAAGDGPAVTLVLFYSDRLDNLED